MLLNEQTSCTSIKQPEVELPPSMQGVLHKDNRDLAIMLDNEGDAVPMAVITA